MSGYQIHEVIFTLGSMSTKMPTQISVIIGTFRGMKQKRHINNISHLILVDS